MDKSLEAVLKSREREYILKKLFKYNGNKPRTAKALGIGTSTLYRKIVELNIKWRR